MKLIITGSLGNISKPLTIDLVQKGHQVTVISRKPENQKNIEAIGATAAIGSLEDIDFLIKTFTDADAVYCMMPPNFGETNQVAYYGRIGANYATAIKQSGVKRVVHLSSYGAHLDKGTGFILGSHNVEGIFNELSEVAITHLRATYFYNNLYSFANMIKQAGFIGSNYGGVDKMVMVHPKDIAVAASEELEKIVSGKTVRYVASDDLSANEIAQILGTAIDKPDLKWLTFTNEQAQAGMEKNGLPPHLVANFIEMGATTHSGAMREDYDLHQPIAMGKTKLIDFAKEFAAAFSKD